MLLSTARLHEPVGALKPSERLGEALLILMHITDIIETQGGVNVSSISSKTDYVFAGDGMGPAKLKKATSLDVPILNETEVRTLLNL